MDEVQYNVLCPRLWAQYRDGTGHHTVLAWYNALFPELWAQYWNCTGVCTVSVIDLAGSGIHLKMYL